MNSPRKPYSLFILLIVAVATAACGEMGKANKLIEEGNASVKAAEKSGQDADAKINKLVEAVDGFPGNRDQLKTTAEETNTLLDQGISKLRDAAQKFDEGSKKDIDAALKEYLSVKSQEYAKHAEHFETIKEIPKAFMDTSIEDNSALQEKFMQISERVDKLKKEWTDLAARADKIYEENKSKFQS
ncbi:MAG TPA: hypothetical protein VJT09_02215 [Pyrinomonadaceae bacterium]|nr:hypothetical protein [Pyrinomonadaceae bacterium]